MAEESIETINQELDFSNKKNHKNSIIHSESNYSNKTHNLEKI